MAIFILSAPLQKCSESWKWLLRHFEWNHTVQVWGCDSPSQGGTAHVSHFLAVSPPHCSQLCCHDLSTEFICHPQPQRVPLDNGRDGLPGYLKISCCYGCFGDDALAGTSPFPWGLWFLISHAASTSSLHPQIPNALAW